MPKETDGQQLNQQNQKFIEIEAPERLAKGQNLYDQEPFSSLIQSICDTSRNSPDVVRSGISRYVEFHFDPRRIDPANLLLPHIKDVDCFLSPYSGTKSISYDDRMKIIHTLGEYPFWGEYITFFKQNMRFGRNGDSMPQFEKYYEKPPPTYVNWLTQKQRSWLVGIEEIFPQDVGHPVTSQPNITGVKPGNRRYRILKAAEIIK